MTRQIEQQLEQLVAKFGERQVLEALDPLVTKCKWNDWQCVANAIRRLEVVDHFDDLSLHGCSFTNFEILSRSGSNMWQTTK